MKEPSAARVDGYQRARRDLRDYVSGWMKHKEEPDARVLAKLVNAAPANGTLTADEWWNVALLLALELEHGA